jgi:hypothetical protein
LPGNERMHECTTSDYVYTVARCERRGMDGGRNKTPWVVHDDLQSASSTGLTSVTWLPDWCGPLISALVIEQHQMLQVLFRVLSPVSLCSCCVMPVKLGILRCLIGDRLWAVIGCIVVNHADGRQRSRPSHGTAIAHAAHSEVQNKRMPYGRFRATQAISLFQCSELVTARAMPVFACLSTFR